MSVLVVIPCLNEAAHLPSLLGQLIADGGAEAIVVADGGSTDGSRDIVTDLARRHPGLRLLDNPDRIQSAGVNRAVRTFGAGHDWLVRIDAHCLYPRGYVAGLVAAAVARGATSVVVPMVTEGRACFQRGVAAAQNSPLGTGGSPHRHIVSGRFVDHGHHALFDLRAFAAAGGYDESYSHNEDAELDQRLLSQGGRLWLEPSLALTYFPRAAARPLARQYLGYGRGRARTLARHRARIKPRQALPLAIAPLLLLALVAGPLFVVTALAGLLILPAAGWAAACLACGAWLAWRARSACVLASGPAAMIMHAAWSAGFWKARLLEPPPGPPPPPLELAADMVTPTGIEPVFQP